MTLAMIEETTDLMTEHRVGPFASWENAPIWFPESFRQVNWQFSSEQAGEPVNVAAWEAFYRALQIAQPD